MFSARYFDTPVAIVYNEIGCRSRQPFCCEWKIMKFNVAQLLLGPTGSTRQFELDDDISGLDPEIVPRSPLEGQVKFTRVGGNVLAEGHAEVDLELICARCLTPFVRRVSIDILEEFEPTVVLPANRSPSGPPEDPALVIDGRNMLDLSEVVRQDLLLAMEDYTHCSEDCAGICPKCGQNLNEKRCECVEEPIDSRWAALAALRDDSAKKSETPTSKE